MPIFKICFLVLEEEGVNHTNILYATDLFLVIESFQSILSKSVYVYFHRKLKQTSFDIVYCIQTNRIISQI